MYGRIKDHIECAFCEKYKGMCVPITYEDEKYYRLTFPDGVSVYFLKENVEVVPTPPKGTGLRDKVTVGDRIDVVEESVTPPKKSKRDKVDEVSLEAQDDSSEEH